MFRFKLSHAMAVVACGLFWSGNAAAQYAPVGVQQNVPEATVTGGGWTVCHSSTYNTGATAMATILADCDQAQIMYACRPVGDPNYTLLAQAPRVDVFTDTGNPTTNPGGFNTPTTSNGVGWYYNDDWSFGFAPAGEPLDRDSCDFNPGTAENLRMCVHTNGGNISGGYRCGNNDLNGNAGWERVILESVGVAPGVTLTIPGSSDPVLVAEELIIPPSRTITNTGNLDVVTNVEYAFSPGEVRYARLECPGVEFAPGSAVTFGGDPSNLIGAVNTTPGGAIYFSITAGATPVVATDTLTVDGDRIINVEQDINCSYSLYDFPSQAQAGGAAGRVVMTSGAYIRFAPSYGLVVDVEGNPVADVESNDPAYSEFELGAPTNDVLLGQIGGFSYGTAADIGLSTQPITLDGAAIELVDLMDGDTALVFAGDFSTAGDVFFSPNADCSVNIQSADSFDANEAVFVIGANPAMNHYLCYDVSGDPIRASAFTVALAPVSADDTTYETDGRGPLDLGEITRNGTELQAPLAQIPGGWLSRLVLTNRGTQDRDYEIAVFGETGTTISTNNLTGIVEAQSTLVVDLDSVLTGFTGGLPRATLNVTVAAPNNTIQGLYQIVNPDSGSISNHVMVRPGSN